MRILNLKSGLVYNLEPRKAGENTSVCPECSLTRKHKNKKSFSWNDTKKTGYCQNCMSSFVEYKPTISDKEYKLPEWKNKTDLTDKAVKYFESRGISQETIKYFKIYSDNEYMPQFEKEIEVFCFPYFYNESLINIKYRGANKSFKLFKDAELIFYNLDAVHENNEIIITEGEFDCLALHTAGFKNVISVPNGANNNLTYLDSSITLFEGKTIIIAVDNDTAGYNLRCELIRRFGSEHCRVVNFKDCKDANEYLLKYGGFDLGNIIKEAESIPVDGIVNFDKCYDAIYDLYLHGLRPGTLLHDELDELVTWETGRLATWTGIPTHGKSEVIDWINVMLNFSAQWKSAYFSPENYPIQYHYEKIASKISGMKFSANTMDIETFKEIYQYVKDNFFFIYPEDNFTFKNILEKAKYLVYSKGIKILTIDPYNRLEHLKERGENETEYISRFLDSITDFAKKNDVLVHLVAHPRKMGKDETKMKYEVPNLYDINGSANFNNKTDYGFSVYRNWDKQKTEIHVLKVKFKHLGEGGVCEKKYNYNNGRFEPYNNSVDVWDNRNFLHKDIQIIKQTEQIPQNENFDLTERNDKQF